MSPVGETWKNDEALVAQLLEHLRVLGQCRPAVGLQDNPSSILVGNIAVVRLQHVDELLEGARAGGSGGGKAEDGALRVCRPLRSRGLQLLGVLGCRAKDHLWEKRREAAACRRAENERSKHQLQEPAKTHASLHRTRRLRDCSTNLVGHRHSTPAIARVWHARASVQSAVRLPFLGLACCAGLDAIGLEVLLTASASLVAENGRLVVVQNALRHFRQQPEGRGDLDLFAVGAIQLVRVLRDTLCKAVLDQAGLEPMAQAREVRANNSWCGKTTASQSPRHTTAAARLNTHAHTYTHTHTHIHTYTHAQTPLVTIDGRHTYNSCHSRSSSYTVHFTRAASLSLLWSQ